MKHSDRYDKLSIYKSFLEFIIRNREIFGMLAVLVIFQLIDKRFMNYKNILGVINSTTPLIVLSLAIMMVMSVRGIDLSIAQVADASAVIVAMLILKGTPAFQSIIITLGFALIIGIINMIFISYLGVPAIIGTLGMMFIVRSFELTLTNGAQPQILFTLMGKDIQRFFFIGQGRIGLISMLMIITAVISVLIYFFRERSVIGRHMTAVRGNVKTSFLSSINVRMVFGISFIISSVFSGVAGIMIVSRAGTAVPRGIESYLVDCFVSVYLGTLISKTHRFNVVGTIIGALFVGFMSNFFTLVGLGASFKYLLNGIFIILAVSLNILERKSNN
jgi:ribose/xylose/arabinose/galactoside ABC-type transport system permease subunit